MIKYSVIFSMLMCAAISLAFTTGDRVTVMSDSSAVIKPGMTVSGSTGFRLGRMGNGDGTWHEYGNTTMTWNQQNTDSITYVGYTVYTYIDNPSGTSISNYSNTASVSFGPKLGTPTPITNPVGV